jgi:hypothetical protein
MLVSLFCSLARTKTLKSSHILQVAFGSDFTEGIEEQRNSLKQPRGSGDLAYLVDLSFRGLEMALRYPAYHVSICIGRMTNF